MKLLNKDNIENVQINIIPYLVSFKFVSCVNCFFLMVSMMVCVICQPSSGGIGNKFINPIIIENRLNISKINTKKLSTTYIMYVAKSPVIGMSVLNKNLMVSITAPGMLKSETPLNNPIVINIIIPVKMFTVQPAIHISIWSAGLSSFNFFFDSSKSSEKLMYPPTNQGVNWNFISLK